MQQLGSISYLDERWVEYGPPDDRRRVGFHDYAELYAVPGLYDRVFRQGLGMRTAERLIASFGQHLEATGRRPDRERVLDVGAGDGIGGELLRTVGVTHVLAVDVEPMAKVAADRDRPGVYARYLVTDAGHAAEELHDERLTAVVALAAIGAGHVSVDDLLALAERLLGPGGIVVFAVADELADATMDRLRRSWRSCATVPFVHRRRPDGSQHGAVAHVAELATGQQL